MVNPSTRFSPRMVRLSMETALLMFFLLFAAGCDTLEEDHVANPDVEVENNSVVILPDGTTLLDLKAMVKSAGRVKLSINTQPGNGSLTEFSDGLFQYSPKAGFNKGKDAFSFSIYSMENTLLDSDTVTIILENDTTKLPCGLYPRNDFVYGITTKTTINVLFNDFLCGDSTDIGLEIFQHASLPPMKGSAVVKNNMIEYTPGAGSSEGDLFIYRVFDKTNSSKVGFATVYILPEPVCNFELLNDSFTFRMDTLQSDTVHLTVLNNDQLCGGGYQLTLPDNGKVGEAFIADPVRYRIPPNVQTSFTDSVTYKVCYGADCRQARAYVSVVK